MEGGCHDGLDSPFRQRRFFARLSTSRRRAAGSRADDPFGLVLANSDEQLLMEQGNGFRSQGRDRTAHAEHLLASRAARAYDLTFLSRCTLYTSAEPCAMCSGAILVPGIGRVVYGRTEKALKAPTGAHEDDPDPGPAVRHCLQGRPRPTGVVRPLLEDEAAALQADLWKARGVSSARPTSPS